MFLWKASRSVDILRIARNVAGSRDRRCFVGCRYRWHLLRERSEDFVQGHAIQLVASAGPSTEPYTIMTCMDVR